MRDVPIALITVLTGAGGLAVGWSTLRSQIVDGPVAAYAEPATTTKHLVTHEMMRASRTMSDRPAPRFARHGADGEAYALLDLTRQGPVVLTFIKDGCPCSEAAQPFFNQIAAAYPDARFLGVIDVEAEAARRWTSTFGVSYPVLPDPQHELVKDYAARNSAYVILIDRDGRIARYWPGFSSTMLDDLGSALARLCGVTRTAVNIADAPVEMYTGCPFDL